MKGALDATTALSTLSTGHNLESDPFHLVTLFSVAISYLGQVLQLEPPAVSALTHLAAVSLFVHALSSNIPPIGRSELSATRTPFDSTAEICQDHLGSR